VLNLFPEVSKVLLGLVGEIFVLLFSKAFLVGGGLLGCCGIYGENLVAVESKLLLLWLNL
jgi:hypothetical protein